MLQSPFSQVRLKLCTRGWGRTEIEVPTSSWNGEHSSSRSLTSPDKPLICSFGPQARVWIWDLSAKGFFSSGTFESNQTKPQILTKHSKPASTEGHELCGCSATVEQQRRCRSLDSITSVQVFTLCIIFAYSVWYLLALLFPLLFFIFTSLVCKHDMKHLWFTEAVMYNWSVITSLMNWPWSRWSLLITLQ